MYLQVSSAISVVIIHHQAITWINAELLAIEPSGTNSSEILNKA